MSRQTPTWAVSTAVGVAALLAAATLLWPRPEPTRPNVLLVVWDTVRADHLSLYGYGRPTTPKLEAWAADATVYERAWSPAMWTLPSHAAMFTGLPASSHGAHGGHRWLDERYETLAETLHDAGYDTAALSSNVFASPMANLTQGFQAVQTSYPRRKGEDRALVEAARRHSGRKRIERDASSEISPAFTGDRRDGWSRAAFKDAAPVLVDALFGWLDDRAEPERPWFAFLNLMEAHTPRIPSEAARAALLEPDVLERGLQTDASLFAFNEYIVGRRTYSEPELEAIRGVYDATLRELDDATAALIDRLEARGDLDDTVVILVSDHGESLGEHGLFEHRYGVWETLLHVPLVVRWPGRAPAGRVAEPVSTLDVYATVLDAAEVPAPRQTPSRSLLGRQPHAPVLFAEMIDPFIAPLRHALRAHPDVDPTPFARSYAVVREGADKLIVASDGGRLLFDLHADPGELRDRSEAEPDRVRALEEAHAAWLERQVPYDPAGATERDRKGAKARSMGTQQMLEALGYAER